jgi:hypothetical protein
LFLLRRRPEADTQSRCLNGNGCFAPSKFQSDSACRGVATG